MDPGVGKWANNALDSPGFRAMLNNSCPEASWIEGEPPHDGAVQVMYVVDSGAFPRFSTMNHALAVCPGRPCPSELLIPLAPLKSSPRVRKTSICTSSVVFTVGSDTKKSRNETMPDSSPKAVEGTLASKVMVCGTFGVSSRVSASLLGSSKLNPSGSWLSSTAIVQSPGFEPVARDRKSVV